MARAEEMEASVSIERPRLGNNRRKYNTVGLSRNLAAEALFKIEPAMHLKINHGYWLRGTIP
jgi:hypothetical protein